MWELIVAIGAPVARALAGWLENAMKDKKIDLPEWQQLGQTLARMIVPIGALIGFGVDPIFASSAVVLSDFLIVKAYHAVTKKV